MTSRMGTDTKLELEIQVQIIALQHAGFSDL